MNFSIFHSESFVKNGEIHSISPISSQKKEKCEFFHFFYNDMYFSTKVKLS